MTRTRARRNHGHDHGTINTRAHPPPPHTSSPNTSRYRNVTGRGGHDGEAAICSRLSRHHRYKTEQPPRSAPCAELPPASIMPPCPVQPNASPPGNDTCKGKAATLQVKASSTPPTTPPTNTPPQASPPNHGVRVSSAMHGAASTGGHGPAKSPVHAPISRPVGASGHVPVNSRALRPELISHQGRVQPGAVGPGVHGAKHNTAKPIRLTTSDASTWRGSIAVTQVALPSCRCRCSS